MSCGRSVMWTVTTMVSWTGHHADEAVRLDEAAETVQDRQRALPLWGRL
jgi:hypothetical protein